MRAPDLTRGSSYEHTYGRWIEFFRLCAEDPRPVRAVPYSWAPFLTYLGCDVRDEVSFFMEDELSPIPLDTARWMALGRLRELVEQVSSLRPELVDALYKSDVLWHTKARRHTMQREFNVTCNGSFFRPEVLSFIERVRTYEPPVCKLTVFVPCAADKPYPAPLHLAVMNTVPEAHLVIATGVLGIIPREMWDEAPVYDSGVPNEMRVEEEVYRFAFAHRARLGDVVVYSDFYGPAVIRALARANIAARWPIGPQVMQTRDQAARASFAHVEYIDLMNSRMLDKLREACR